MQAKKLIEVAMPIKEISAESVRDKSIRHGHISTLHLWWARRPLPASRAIIFSSLVPDPCDENCPVQFKEAVDLLLGSKENLGDPYKPYVDIPYTAAVDLMEDNLRNRLMMFIGKFSDEYCENERNGKSTPSLSILNNSCLIKWDNKNNEDIINKARKLIWVANNTVSSKPLNQILNEYDKHIYDIKSAEFDLYNSPNRHIKNENILEKEKNLQSAIDSFQEKMPKVFDPFAGGGALPLEAARLGCKTYGNDINPVAHIIQKGGLEFPQKYGKKIILSKNEFILKYGISEFNKIDNSNFLIENGEVKYVIINNRLSFDVDYYARRILKSAHDEIGKYYPLNKSGEDVIAYYWARVGHCTNLTCKAEIPLLKGFYLVNTPTKKYYLKPNLLDRNITFTIEEGVCEDIPWLNKSLNCPFCGATTSSKELKEQSVNNKLNLKLLAVIESSTNGKKYRVPSLEEIEIAKIDFTLIDKSLVPSEKMSLSPDLISTRGWGFESWSHIFTDRQLLMLTTLVKKMKETIKSTNDLDNEYGKALITLLSLWFDRIAISNTSLGRWHVGKESLEHPFSKQAIPMIFDFPESNMFCNSTGSALNQLEWIIRYVESESNCPFSVELKNASSGDKSQFPDKYLTACITDPPYFDAIAYADLSDFFYVWMKRTLGDYYNLNFATPTTPKTEECTALKHHHNNDKVAAKNHFEKKLTQIFDAIEQQTSDIVSIMFAHQSTDAWTTLCNSILDARMNITGSWPIDTEMANRSLGLSGAVLASSVTVSARPSQRTGVGNYKDVKNDITKTVSKEVDELFKLGLRGADLLTACFGQAVSEFGKYESVEKLDGSKVGVLELLEMARDSAFNALLKGFVGDDFTKFYIGWLQLFGFSTNDHNTALRIVQVGLSIDINDLYREHILIQDHNNSTLANSVERNNRNKNLGEKNNSTLIDKVHKAMSLFNANSRYKLVEYISSYGSESDNSFWRVVTSLCEILPQSSEDYRLANELLSNKESLIKESKIQTPNINQQRQLEF